VTRLQHVIRADQFADRELLASLFRAASRLEIEDRLRTLPTPLRGRIMATLFFEPSTRTRFSFEAAMQKLGGGVLTAENARYSSSSAKGESIADTVRVVSGYCDAIVIRHFEEGTARAAAEASPVPVINAGDGAGEHPTQAIGDLFTIHQELGRLENLRVAVVGDLLFGRTIHSLLAMLAPYRGLRVQLISPPQLRLPERYRKLLSDYDVPFAEQTELDGALGDADVVYITRVQRERFPSEEDYAAVAETYVLGSQLLETLKASAIILHALPRLTEIAPEVDSDPRAAYFRQARNGLYMRMALLEHLLG